MQLPYLQLTDYVDNPIARIFYGRLHMERGYSHIYYRQDDASHQLIVQLKYHHRPDIGRKVGRMVAVQIVERGFFDGVDGIVPVPLHWSRRLARGYNQSMQLARGLSDVSHVPVFGNVVRRTVNNASQTRMQGTEARVDNMRGVFTARSTELSHILLVDDVLTTGATIMECARAIARQNPDIRFSVFTLAKAR